MTLGLSRSQGAPEMHYDGRGQEGQLKVELAKEKIGMLTTDNKIHFEVLVLKPQHEE